MNSADLSLSLGGPANWLRNWHARYGFALVAVTAAAVVLGGLDRAFGFSYPFVLFSLAVLIVAQQAGFGPALFATVAATGTARYLFLNHVNPDRLSKVTSNIAMLVFVIVGLGVSWLADSARRRANRLQEFERVVEGLDEMIVVVDRNYRYLIANRAFLNYRGGKREQVIGRLASEILNPGVFEAVVRQKLDECFQGKVVQYEMPYLYPAPRGERELRITYFPISGLKGIDRVACVLQDVTRQKEADRSLRLFRTLIDQSNDAVEVIDSQTMRFLDVNEKACKDLGFTREELLGMTVGDIDPDVREGACGASGCDLLQQGFIVKETSHRRKDGSIFPVETSLTMVQLDRNYIVAVSRDISERKQAEKAIRDSEERFRVALKDSPITVFNQDVELRYTWIYNPHLYWQEDVLGKTDEEILGRKKAANLSKLKRRVLETRNSVREEVVVPDYGQRVVFDMSIEPLYDDSGNLMGITGACMDIARLREMTDRLQDTTDRLSQEKSYLEGEIRTELGFEDSVGRSAALMDVLAKAKVVAPTDSNVLLLGETGTGKELVARSIHRLSTRNDKTFIKLNCAAVPSGLLESELFGHEKGAYTSAVGQKIGRIELADKGTLFLDEIGELPLELQPKLLRVLQDRDFERLGGVHTLRVDVRIIAATNRDLQQDIAAKKFREDLFYRLNVFPIELPPLRQRREDIPMLVQHFVEKYSARMSKHIESIPTETMLVLEKWNWPGNIRELENMIERMVILTKGNVLADPPAELDAWESVDEDNLNEMEREHIIRVLREANGVLAGTNGAAIRLGLKRTTLQSMLKRFGIDAEHYRHGAGTFGK